MYRAKLHTDMMTLVEAEITNIYIAQYFFVSYAEKNQPPFS